MRKFVLGGVELSGEFSTLPGFYFEGQVDWYARSESKAEVNERPQAHGAFGIGNDWQSSLAPSIRGHWQGESPADAVRAMLRLNAIGAGGRKVLASFTDDLHTTSRWVSVRRVTPEDYRGRKVVRFTIDMIAPDPLAYGPAEWVSTGPRVSGGGLLFPLGVTPTKFWDFGADGKSGRVEVANVGTADVWPTLSMSGGLSAGFVVSDVTSGRTVRFERLIPEGSTVKINQRTGTASIDGQSDVSGFITVREFFSVAAESSHQIQLAVLGAVTGSPLLTVSWAPAYH